MIIILNNEENTIVKEESHNPPNQHHVSSLAYHQELTSQQGCKLYPTWSSIRDHVHAYASRTALHRCFQLNLITKRQFMRYVASMAFSPSFVHSPMLHVQTPGVNTCRLPRLQISGLSVSGNFEKNFPKGGSYIK